MDLKGDFVYEFGWVKVVILGIKFSGGRREFIFWWVIVFLIVRIIWKILELLVRIDFF